MAIEQFNYQYTGTKNGVPITSDLMAKDERTAKTILLKQGIKVTKISLKKQNAGKKGKAIKPKDLSVVSRQLSTMLNAGVPLVQSFDILAKGDNNITMSTLLFKIKSDIEGGSPLADALAVHPQYFDGLYCSLVAAGEQAGVLDSILEKIATYKEKTESLKAKIKKAMTYPIGVMIVAAIVTSILLLFVVPVFSEMFKGFGADLPAFTQFVVDLSESLKATWYIYIGVLVAASWGFKTAKARSKAFNVFLDRTVLKIPVIGEILLKGAIARFARTLSTLSAAGVPMIEALSSVAGASGNVVFYDAIMKMRESVATGIQLKVAMQQSNLFPHLVISMTAIGEESGSLDAMLGKVASFFEEDVENAVDNLTAMLEPIIMAVLGVVIGGLIIAMYLPIFKMGSVI